MFFAQRSVPYGAQGFLQICTHARYLISNTVNDKYGNVVFPTNDYNMNHLYGFLCKISCAKNKEIDLSRAPTESIVSRRVLVLREADEGSIEHRAATCRREVLGPPTRLAAN